MIILHIAGHLGNDPETRFTATGKKVISFRVATNIKRGGKEKTVWWRVTVWEDRANLNKIITYLKKGSAVYVVGEMGIPEIYTDKNGQPQTSFDITAEVISFSPFGRPGTKPADSAAGVPEESPESAGYSFAGKAEPGVVPGAGQANFAEDDIPF